MHGCIDRGPDRCPATPRAAPSLEARRGGADGPLQGSTSHTNASAWPINGQLLRVRKSRRAAGRATGKNFTADATNTGAELEHAYLALHERAADSASDRRTSRLTELHRRASKSARCHWVFLHVALHWRSPDGPHFACYPMPPPRRLRTQTGEASCRPTSPKTKASAEAKSRRAPRRAPAAPAAAEASRPAAAAAAAEAAEAAEARVTTSADLNRGSGLQRRRVSRSSFSPSAAAFSRHAVAAHRRCSSPGRPPQFRRGTPHGDPACAVRRHARSPELRASACVPSSM